MRPNSKTTIAFLKKLFRIKPAKVKYIFMWYTHEKMAHIVFAEGHTHEVYASSLDEARRIFQDEQPAAARIYTSVMWHASPIGAWT